MFYYESEEKKEEIEELAASIEKDGLLQPILVRQIADGTYQIIACERRWQASKAAGLKKVPVRVKEVDDDQALELGKRYDFKLGTSFSGGRIRAIDYQIDVNSLEQHPAQQLPLNGIARVEIELDNPLAFDEYQLCQATGSFVVIDRLSNVTIGAGMIRQPLLDSSPPLQHTNTPFEQDLKALIQKHFPHWWP